MNKGWIHLGTASQIIHSFQKLEYMYDYININKTRDEFKKLSTTKGLEENASHVDFVTSVNTQLLFSFSLNPQNNVGSILFSSRIVTC